MKSLKRSVSTFTSTTVLARRSASDSGMPLQPLPKKSPARKTSPRTAWMEESDAPQHSTEVSTQTAPAPTPDRVPSSNKFSFVSDPSVRQTDVYDYSGSFTHQVPNNTPKRKLPMWSSSLTHPSLGRRRMEEKNWASTAENTEMEIREDDPRVVAFLKSLEQFCTAEETERLRAQLTENVILHLRKADGRGLYARRPITEGEVLLEIPLPNTSKVVKTGRDGQRALGFAVNAEALQLGSIAAADRACPSFQTIKETLHDYAKNRASSFEPVPHILFIDLLHCAALLSCERAIGSKSVYGAYFDLFSDKKQKVD
ncbi:hypothetical protein ADEAN_000135000 [Angomonas deanei]|uniref:Uncharacterized protein n=1 Tax=Angomonas deanei TaxID=59799 RepID=A0A7G2C2M6_9TRYP|nr:hypothetical protein ADEAN_000135000 [Angomonas deanei]